jgi:molecular chaperone GrpE
MAVPREREESQEPAGEREGAREGDGLEAPGVEAQAAVADLRADVERLAGERAELQRIYDELHDRYLRAHADFDNSRKRWLKERAEETTRAQAELLTQILDPLDDLSRATSVEATTPEARSLVEGFRLVHEKLTAALQAIGLQRVVTDGQRFDPEQHEAVSTVRTRHPKEDGRIVQELAPGYRFGDRLLRAARVQVMRYVPEEERSS